MIPGMQCVITGCTLIIYPDHEGMNPAGVNGDLFALDGEYFVFNANVAIARPIELQRKDYWYEKTFTLENFWERRGVYIFHQEDVEFNQAALDHLERAPT